MGGIVSTVLDALFPRYCLSCREEGGLVCGKCQNDFQDILKYERGDHVVSFAYGNPLIRDLIKTWKYHYDMSAFWKLQELAEPTLGDLRAFIKQEDIRAISFIPLSHRRECERGFNQAKMIAEWVGRECDVHVEHLLGRKEKSGHQAERTDEERKEAMKDSPFVVRKTAPLSAQRILLVDDVWTTGATMKSAAQALTENGVEKVLFYTLAKGR